jgi:hypothetical protein
LISAWTCLVADGGLFDVSCALRSHPAVLFYVGEIEAVEFYQGVETPPQFLRVGRSFFP